MVRSVLAASAAGWELRFSATLANSSMAVEFMAPDARWVSVGAYAGWWRVLIALNGRHELELIDAAEPKAAWNPVASSLAVEVAEDALTARGNCDSASLASSVPDSTAWRTRGSSVVTMTLGLS